MQLLSEKRQLVEPGQEWVGKHRVLPDELPTDGSRPAEDKAIAYGFITSRPRTAQTV